MYAPNVILSTVLIYIAVVSLAASTSIHFFFWHIKISSSTEPQSYGLHSYGLHSYGILGQPDTDIEYINGKYHQNFYKMRTGHQF